jgi:diguanylate cyclase (GGDEF)-like protein
MVNASGWLRALVRLCRIRGSSFVLVGIWAVGLFALASVFVLQRRLDDRDHAQLAVAHLQTDFSRMPALAFATSRGLSRAQVQVELLASERKVDGEIVRLEQLANDQIPGKLLTAPAERLFRSLESVNALVSSGRAVDASRLLADESARGGSERALTGAFVRLSGEYDREAASARRMTELGSVGAALFMLLAFSVAFRRASKLARERHRQALTDQLTGLSNRRRLFADMEELLREHDREGKLVLAMFDLDGFKGYNDSFGHPAGDALLARLARKLEAAIDGTGKAYRLGGDEFCVIARGENAEASVAKAQAALSEPSEAFTVTSSVGSVLIAPDQMSLEEALRQADQRLYDYKRTSRNGNEVEARDVLLRVLSESGESLATHVSNVGRLAAAVARQLGLSEDEVTLARLTAELHDVGKTAIPDAILNKPGPLDPAEWEFMKRHTLIGERILAAAPALARVAPLVRATHERSDGTGYPDGLHENEIPLSARIVAVVDAYDAMTADRPYRTPLTSDQAISELRRCAGSQFDPAVTDAFIAVYKAAANKAAAAARSDRDAPLAA